MDKLYFRISPDNKCDIYINDENLFNIVKNKEIEIGQKGAGEYANQYCNGLLRNLEYVATKELDVAELLICKKCNVPGCWSVAAEITINEKSVNWKIFQLNTKNEYFNFSFNKEQYNKEIEKLNIFVKHKGV